MSEITKTTAAVRTITLCGKKYRVTPIRDRDYADFEAFLQDHAIEVAKRSLDGLSSKDRQVLLQHAYNKAARITIASSEATIALTSLEGITKLLWLSLRHEHPDLEEEDLLKMLCDPQAMEDAAEIIERVEKLGGSKQSKANPLRKVKRKKR